MWQFAVCDWMLHIWPKQPTFWNPLVRLTNASVTEKKTDYLSYFCCMQTSLECKPVKFLWFLFWHLLYQHTMFTHTINKRLPPFFLIWFVNDFVWSVRPDSLPFRRAGQKVCSSFDWASQMMQFAFLTHHFSCLNSTTLPHTPSRDVMPSSVTAHGTSRQRKGKAVRECFDFPPGINQDGISHWGSDLIVCTNSDCTHFIYQHNTRYNSPTPSKCVIRNGGCLRTHLTCYTPLYTKIYPL